MKSSTNNFVAGVFTILGVVGFVFIILTLSGVSSFTHARSKYTVQFSLADGAKGLKNGSDVSVGGQTVGQVKSVAFSPKTGAAQAIDVFVSINSDVVLYHDAVISQVKPLLGDVSAIDVPSIGTPGAGRLLPGETIKGQIASPSFLAQAGFGDKQRNQLQQIIDNVAVGSDDFKKITGTINAHAEPTMKSVNDAATDIRSVAGDIKTRINEWSPRIDNTLKNAEQFSSELLTTRRLFDEALEKAKSFITDVQSLVRDNRPRIDSTIKSVDEFTTKLNNELYAQVQSTLAEAQKTMHDFSEAGRRVSAFVAEEAPELRLTLANARLASDQLKLTMTEVRRNPWRLLYQPGKKELERELLYDAARDYASAVSDLHAASTALESVTAAGAISGSPLPPERIAEIQKSMQNSFARYKEAEAKFLEMVLKEGK